MLLFIFLDRDKVKGIRTSSRKLDMATNTSLSGSGHQKSSQDESHLVAGQQQPPEITPAVEGAEFQSVAVEPSASGIEIPSRNLLLTLLQNISSGLKENKPPASTYAFTYISGRRQSEGNKSVITQGIKQIYDLKSDHANAMELLRRIAKYISTLDKAQILQGAVRYAMIGAAKLGVTEFIIETGKANPDVMSFTDDHCRNIFMIAAIHRQEKVVSLICGIPALTGQLLPYLGPDSEAKLTQISGAALQMQRELQWFKETKNILPQVHARYTNNKMQTAKQIFDETHKDLRKQGEEWMKQLASSSTVVGTLIMTIMFAAAFIVPGGNDQNNGFPIFLTSGHKHEVAFMIFIISDAISLFASSTSVLMFLGILTTRYAMEDFLTSLPNKLIIGLSTLFISIATMMAAFCASLVIMLQGRLWIIIPIILLASIPITLFAWLQFPLLVEVIVSTYGAGIFDRKMKPWI
ncbi:PGG domain - like 10 [Theobroma cacao]|nr:PGG domain - like 10 [Theobroma cacao]